MRPGLQRFTNYSWLVLFIIIQVACSDPRPKERRSKDGLEAHTIQKTKPGSSYSDTITIKSPAAVFYFPDSMQLEKLKAITDRVIFEATLHDCFYQMRNSRKILERSYGHVHVVEVKHARYVAFEKLSGEKEYLDLNTQSDPCGLFVFDGSKSHRLVDMTNIDTELGFYFRNDSRDP